MTIGAQPLLSLDTMAILASRANYMAEIYQPSSCDLLTSRWVLPQFGGEAIHNWKSELIGSAVC